MTLTDSTARYRRRLLYPHGLFLLAASFLLVVGLAPSSAAPLQGEQREVNRSFAAADGMRVDLENLAGEVTIEGTSGGQVEVVATIHAESGGGTDASTLLGLLQVEFESDGDELDITANYPVNRYRTYRYPRRQGRGTTNTQTRYQGERVRVTSRSDDDAVTLYVDFTLRIPAGVSVSAENVAGDISADGMRGELSADTGSGNVSAANGTGRVEADTGSGDVRVTAYEGDIGADTGSGNVEIRDVTGDVSADTGSGDIRLVDVEARRVEADTGSGEISLERVSGSLNVDTGSGDIEAESLSAGAVLTADTGSGDVRLSGDMSRVEEIEIDTGSGDVELEMSAAPGMRITIETGNGGINVDLPDMRVITSRRNYFRGESGDGGTNVSISTGAGSVRIRSR